MWPFVDWLTTRFPGTASPPEGPWASEFCPPCTTPCCSWLSLSLLRHESELSTWQQNFGWVATMSTFPLLPPDGNQMKSSVGPLLHLAGGGGQASSRVQDGFPPLRVLLWSSWQEIYRQFWGVAWESGLVGVGSLVANWSWMMNQTCVRLTWGAPQEHYLHGAQAAPSGESCSGTGVGCDDATLKIRSCWRTAGVCWDRIFVELQGCMPVDGEAGGDGSIGAHPHLGYDYMVDLRLLMIAHLMEQIL